MNTREIDTILSCNVYSRQFFDGVYSLDNLQDIVHRPKLIVCNTDPSNKPGEHWVLFYFTDNDNVEFFDSLGKHPAYYGTDFINFMTAFSRKCIFNGKRIQHIDTSLCGHYCVLYAINRCKGNNMLQSIVNVLEMNQLEDKVTELLSTCQNKTTITCNQKCISS